LSLPHKVSPFTRIAGFSQRETCLNFVTYLQIYDSLATNNVKPLRLWLVTEESTDASLGFAFAEYPTAVDAASALEYLRRIDYAYHDEDGDQVPCELTFGRDLFVLNK
jgi:hypothetical protein